MSRPQMLDIPLRIFVGFDPRQMCSFTVLQASILKFTTKPVSIIPLMLNTMPIDNAGLTPFTYSRFLVPWLCDYQGVALFIDCDMMFRADPFELFEKIDMEQAVTVADLPDALSFERASVMLFNCAHPDNQKLTPPSVQVRKTTLIDWTKEIGRFPSLWNHLVGYQLPNPNAKLVHFTQGVPLYAETEDSEFAEEWRDLVRLSISSYPWAELMADSVHSARDKDGTPVPRYRIYPPAGG